jgi:predicted transcriptional regulator
MSEMASSLSDEPASSEQTARKPQSDLAAQVFHLINRIIPEDQVLVTVEPTCLVREAIALMRHHGFSRLPVREGSQVLGVFSFRSLGQQVAKDTLADWNKQKCSPGDLPVDDFLEQLEFTRVTDDMRGALNAIERDDAVLVGTPEQLVAILTSIDVLRYLDKLTSPFVWLSEIEGALRELIKIAMTPEQVAAAAKRCLSSAYRDESKVPTSLEEMTFGNYESLISHSDTWSHFEPIFGGARVRVSSRLKEVGSIRNDLFHFKRAVVNSDYESLVAHRSWFVTKVKQADARRRMEAPR